MSLRRTHSLAVAVQRPVSAPPPPTGSKRIPDFPPRRSRGALWFGSAPPKALTPRDTRFGGYPSASLRPPRKAPGPGSISSRIAPTRAGNPACAPTTKPPSGSFSHRSIPMIDVVSAGSPAMPHAAAVPPALPAEGSPPRCPTVAAWQFGRAWSARGLDRFGRQSGRDR
jgi:hypothetical protein